MSANKITMAIGVTCCQASARKRQGHRVQRQRTTALADARLRLAMVWCSVVASGRGPDHFGDAEVGVEAEGLRHCGKPRQAAIWEPG